MKPEFLIVWDLSLDEAMFTPASQLPPYLYTMNGDAWTRLWLALYYQYPNEGDVMKRRINISLAVNSWWRHHRSAGSPSFIVLCECLVPTDYVWYGSSMIKYEGRASSRSLDQLAGYLKSFNVGAIPMDAQAQTGSIFQGRWIISLPRWQSFLWVLL